VIDQETVAVQDFEPANDRCGQKHALPHRNSNGRLTSLPGHRRGVDRFAPETCGCINERANHSNPAPA
jgi:hypothetical protein